MIVVMLGQIASGKTVQAEYLAEEYGAARLSLGAVLRSKFPDDPRLEDGELLPAAMVEEAVSHFFAQIYGGDKDELIVIDGFPRTLQQKEWLDQYLTTHDLKVNKALVFEVEPEEVDKRLSIRQRVDDTAEAIAQRKLVFYEKVQYVIEAYERDGIVFRIDGNDSIEAVSDRVSALIS